jgi:peptide/nickel transport system substrate-binding protein
MVRQLRGVCVSATAVALSCLMAVACQSTTPAASGSVSPGSVPSGSPTGVAAEGTPKPGGSVVFGVDAEPAGLNPAANNFSTSNMMIASSVFETLTVFDKDQKTQPYLAESLTPEDLAAKWTIKLKPNITFHDGTAFDATAVKANLDAYWHGLSAIAMKVVSDIKVVDKLTVEVDMTKPWASFPSFLGSEEGLMQSPANITAPDAATHPIGTGPFVFDRWDRGTKIVTKKNPNYWQAGQPYLDGLEFRFLTDPTSRANALSSGDIDLMFVDSPKTIAGLQSKPDFRTILDKSGDAQSIVMNEASAPFDNTDARKALVLATDSKAVVDSFGNGVLSPTDQPFSEANPYHQTDSHYAGFNLAEAKKAVQAYTAATGKPLQFTLTLFTGSDGLELAQLLQAQWKAAGIDAQISAVDQAKGIGDVIFGRTQAVLNPNFGYPDPDWQYSFWHSDFTAPVGQLSINFPHLKNDALDKALDTGRVSLVPSIRKDAYNQAAQILNDNFAYVWIYRYVAALVASNRVHGLQKAEEEGFANLAARNWYQNLWVST